MRRGVDKPASVTNDIACPLQLALRRGGKMRTPIEVGERQRYRRNPAGESRQHRVECTIKRVWLGDGLRVARFCPDGRAHEKERDGERSRKTGAVQIPTT